MKKWLKVLTWLCVISIGLNVYSLNRLATVERNLISYINSNDNMLHSSISHLNNYLYQAMEEVKQEARWIGAQEFKANIELSSPQEIHLDLEWSFRELEQSAQVLLLYRAKPQGEWQQVIAKKLATNHFRAPLVLSPELSYEYQILTQGQINRTSEISNIPSQYYQPSPLYYSGAGGSSANGRLMQFEVSFAQREPVSFDFYKVTAVTAKVYQDSIYTERPLSRTHRALDRQDWQLDMNDFDLNKEVTKFILEIEYADGSIKEDNFTYEVVGVMNSMRG